MQIPQDDYHVLLEADHLRYLQEMDEKKQELKQRKMEMKQFLDSQVRDVAKRRSDENAEQSVIALQMKQDLHALEASKTAKRQAEFQKQMQLKASREVQVRRVNDKKLRDFRKQLDEEKEELRNIKQDLLDERKKKARRKQQQRIAQFELEVENEKWKKIRMLQAKADREKEKQHVEAYRKKLDKEEEQRFQYFKSMRDRANTNQSHFEDTVRDKKREVEREEKARFERHQEELYRQQALKHQQGIERKERGRAEMVSSLEAQIAQKLVNKRKELEAGMKFAKQVNHDVSQYAAQVQSDAKRRFEEQKQYKGQVLIQAREQVKINSQANHMTLMRGKERQLNSKLYKAIESNSMLKQQLVEKQMRRQLDTKIRQQNKLKPNVRDNYFA